MSAGLDAATLVARQLRLEALVDVSHADGPRIENALRGHPGTTVITVDYLATGVRITAGVEPDGFGELAGFVASLTSGAGTVTPGATRPGSTPTPTAPETALTATGWRAGGLGASGRAGASSAAYDKMVLMALHLATTAEGNALLQRDPLALLLGMQLDQQIPMEKAFTSPSVLAERMGADHLDAATIAALPPETLLEYFRTPPALHRFPGPWRSAPSNCARRSSTSGTATPPPSGPVPSRGSTWSTDRQPARLRRQEGEDLRGAARQAVRRDPAGWQEATGDYGQPHRSIADVVDDESRVKVREFKKAKKAALKG